MQQKAKYPHLKFISVNFSSAARMFFTVFASLATLMAFGPVKTLGESAHGISMHGELKHGPDFKHFSYVNPDAPRKGRLKTALFGTFDSFNPLIPKGVPVPYVRNYVYESLMARAYDEPFSLYGLLAEKIETPEDRSWVSFTLRKEARFSDGKPVTVDDVIYTLELLRKKGRPNHRTFYGKVQKIEKIGKNTVKFIFKSGIDREMALIMGLMPILPKHAMSEEDFQKTGLKKPVGSGPYTVASVSPGERVLFKRNPDYWGKDVPAVRGLYNFEEIQVDYFRNNDTMFEAFKTGLIHQWIEDNPSKWKSAFNFSALKDKRVLRKEIKLAIPSGMDGLVFNTRREVFADKRVRQALIYMFDFEWINRTLFYGLYSRTRSFFDRSELASSGKPADDYELNILQKYPDAVDKKILDGTYSFPATNGKGSNRKNMRKALRLFKAAGYILKSGKLLSEKTGKQLEFEVLLLTRAQERLVLTYAEQLKKIGIKVNLRLIDKTQYEARKGSFDFDMIQYFWPSSLSPGNEQLFRWSQNSADNQGSYNYPGVKDIAVDSMINAMLAAKKRKDFVSAVRALDRVLLSGHYMVPLYHSRKQWLAHWAQLKCPEKSSLYGHLHDTCWME